MDFHLGEWPITGGLFHVIGQLAQDGLFTLLDILVSSKPSKGVPAWYEFIQ